MDFIPETQQESSIITSDIFNLAVKSAGNRPGHLEKDLGEPIQQILAFINKQPWVNYRRDLRVLAFLHDLGKARTTYDESGSLVGKGHSTISQEIATEFTNDQRLLYLIRIHDKYFHFYRDDGKGKLNKSKFLKTYNNTDLETLTRFHYADSNNRERSSAQWFEDQCAILGLKKERLYEIEPEVLI
ncbi:HD domain-containing protein [Candidatus Pacearchaeota archaeon]|nr:HD domain-containing protein [Candidatus Pacearchaeota archaeon]